MLCERKKDQHEGLINAGNVMIAEICLIGGDDMLGKV